LLAVICFTTQHGIATQTLITMGAPLPSTLLPGLTVCDDFQQVCLPAANCRLATLDWLALELGLLYDWRFIANQFVLASSLLRLIARFIPPPQLNPCSHNPYVTSSLTGWWVCLLWISLAFVKCKYGTYSMTLKILPLTIYKSPLLIQALQSRSCLSYLSYATAVA
jgi:hypothetical protein